MTELSREAQHLALDEELQEPDPPVLISEEQAAQEDAPERPDYLEPRYKTVEDQAKAYKEAERTMHEANRRALDLEQRLAALEQQSQPQQEPEWEQPYYDPMQQAMQAGDYESQLRALAEEDPVLAMRAIVQEQAQQQQQAQMAEMQRQAEITQQQTAAQQQQQATYQNTQAQLIADAAYERAVSRHPDYEEYHSEVVQMINDPEWINPQDTWDLGKLERAVERAYTVTKAQRITATDEQLIAQGLSPDEIERQRKANAQTLQGRSGGPEPELTQEEQNLAGILNSGTDGSYASVRRTLWGDLRQP